MDIMTVAEFINSVNGAISGTYYVITKELTPGALCSINGWLGQVSVQASDFSMFAIAVVSTLFFFLFFFFIFCKRYPASF